MVGLWLQRIFGSRLRSGYRLVRMFGTSKTFHAFVIVGLAIWTANGQVRQSRKPTPTPTPDVYAQAAKEYIDAHPIVTSSAGKILSSTEIAKRILPSLLVVIAQDNQGNPIALGSGFIVAKGLAITNLHVLKRASEASVHVAGTRLNLSVGGVLSVDREHDLCVLQIDDSSIPVLQIAEKSPNVGEEVFAFGNPRGLEGTVSKGVVSGLRKDMGLLQIDAPISPGSSGGPIVNSRGQVVGVTVSSLTNGQSINFAIPSQFIIRLSVHQFGSFSPEAIARALWGEKVVADRYAISVSEAGVIGVTDRENAGLRGAVKTVQNRSAIYDYKETQDKYIEGELVDSGREVYDVAGNLAEEWTYENGALTWKYNYQHDENGLLLRQTWQPASADSAPPSTDKFDLGEQINRKLRDFNSTGIFETESGKWVYDENGNNVETISTKINTHSRTKYDENGRATQEEYFTDGILRWTDRYTYESDREGNWVKRTHFRMDEKFSSLGFTPFSVTYRQITYF